MPIDVASWWQFFAVALSSILFLVDPVATMSPPASLRSVARLPRGKRMATVKGQDHGRFWDFYHNILTVS